MSGREAVASIPDRFVNACHPPGEGQVITVHGNGVFLTLPVLRVNVAAMWTEG
jgi:hypothetical protein